MSEHCFGLYSERSTDLKFPKFLPKGGRIGFIAPSFGCTTSPYRECFEAALGFFETQGYRNVPGPNCFEDKGVGKSNTPEACGAEINDFFINDRSDIIISCGGGETMCEDLPYVDFEGIAKAEPKWYMGFSDNTNLTFLLPTLCDTAAVYGPCAASFGQEKRHVSIDDAFRLLKGEKLVFTNYDKWELEQLKSAENPYLGYNTTEPYSQRVYIGNRRIQGTDSDFSAAKSNVVSFEGRLIGGCLDCLINLTGTPFDRAEEFAQKYADDGIIWFIESCELNVMSQRRALWHLEQAGWFKNVKGFVIGRPMLYNDCFQDLDHYRAAVDILGKYGVPIVMDVDLGHLPPMLPFVSGAYAYISAGENTFTIKQELR